MAPKGDHLLDTLSVLATAKLVWISTLLPFTAMRIFGLELSGCPGDDDDAFDFEADLQKVAEPRSQESHQFQNAVLFPLSLKEIDCWI